MTEKGTKYLSRLVALLLSRWRHIRLCLAEAHLRGLAYNKGYQEDLSATPFSGVSDANYVKGDRCRSGFALFRAGATFAWKCTFNQDRYSPQQSPNTSPAALQLRRYSGHANSWMNLDSNNTTNKTADGQSNCDPYQQGTANCDRTSHIETRKCL